MNTFKQAMTRFFNDEEGASAIEYALIVGLIALALVTVLGLTGTALTNLFTDINTTLNGVGS